MARTSNITFGQVAAIADAMKAAGTRPTARAVRERIGSGSMGTIHKLLTQWNGKGSESDEDSEAAELPSHIQNALMDFIGTEIATACEPLNEELQAAKEAAEDLAESNERINAAYDEQGRDLMHCQQERAAAMAQLALTREALKEAQQKWNALEESNNEYRLELDRSQRQVEMLASYAPELAQAKAALSEMTEKATAAEKSAAVLTAQLTAETAKSEELRARLDQGEKTHKSLQNEFIQENIRYRACAARLEAAAREIESLRKPKAAPKVATPKPAKKATSGNTRQEA